MRADPVELVAEKARSVIGAHLPAGEESAELVLAIGDEAQVLGVARSPAEGLGVLGGLRPGRRVVNVDELRGHRLMMALGAPVLPA